jgi:exodeoxyribonuclease VII small subunit
MPPETPSDSEPTFEVALSRLEGIVRDLEDGDLGLAEALARYEAGVGLLKDCHRLLEHAERKIELLSGFDAEGNPVTVPFDDTASATGDAEPKQRSRKRSAATPRSSARPERAEPSAPRTGDAPQIDELPGLF